MDMSEEYEKQFPSLRLLMTEPGLHSILEDEWVCLESHLDSGAAKSVCPLDYCSQFPVRETEASKSGESFRTATGTKIANEGERVVRGQSEGGTPISMRYAVADVTVPLDSVAQICDSGAVVYFNSTGGYIINERGRQDFARQGNACIRRTWVKKPKKRTDADVEMRPVGFHRQGKV